MREVNLAIAPAKSLLLAANPLQSDITAAITTLTSFIEGLGVIVPRCTARMRRKHCSRFDQQALAHSQKVSR